MVSDRSDKSDKSDGADRSDEADESDRAEGADESDRADESDESEGADGVGQELTGRTCWMRKVMDFRWRWIFYIAVVVFFSFVFLRTAWLCDDAYITYRVVDNFVNGFGLRWNVAERVQVYTHPLWMLIQIPFYALTREGFLTWIFISFGISMIGIALFFLLFTENISQMLIAWSLLGFSRAFIDFSSSGLENPLSHVLLILFFWFYFKQEYNYHKLFWLSFIASLATLNRLDCVLLYLPSLLYVWIKMERKWVGFLVIGMGFLPFMAWEMFSIIYYGFPYPNTAYAKLGTGIWKVDLITQGFRYLFWSWKNDLITIAGLCTALLMPMYQRKPELMSSVLGIFLYLCYVVWIGGDFMGGRFLTVPFLLAVILIVRYSNQHRYFKGIPTALVFVTISLIQPDAPIVTDSTFGKDLDKYHSDFKESSFVGNERMFYFQIAGLPHWKSDKPMPSNDWAQRGREYRKLNKDIVKIHGAIGATGFFAGPRIHIVDYYGLADPLLARLPTIIRPTWTSGWRIGHFERFVPKGYVETIENDCNINKIQDKNLAQFFDYLSIITRGPIWTKERFWRILGMNLGLYDYLIDKDFYKFPYRKRLRLAELESLTQNDNTLPRISKGGVSIELEKVCRSNMIKIDLDPPMSVMILFIKDKVCLGRRTVTIEEIEGLNNGLCLVQVPMYSRIRGFDEIRILPYSDKRTTILKGLWIE